MVRQQGKEGFCVLVGLLSDNSVSCELDEEPEEDHRCPISHSVSKATPGTSPNTESLGT